MDKDFFDSYCESVADKGRLKLPKPKDLTFGEFCFLKKYVKDIVELTPKILQKNNKTIKD